MDFKTRKLYYNRCGWKDPLAPGDDRNLDVDRFGAKLVRGLNWVERLAGRIELADAPTLVLFTGLPGSGKSTELRRLAARLEEPKGANLLAVVIDAEQVVDLANPIDIPDIIATIVHQTESKVLQKEGGDPKRALETGYLARLWSWLTDTDVELTKAEYAIPSGPNLVIELKTRPTLRDRVRKIIATNLTTFLDRARAEVTSLRERARQLQFADLVVIYDSLEKLRGSSENWNDVLASAERVFGGGAPYLRLPVHVLYTIPAALISRRVEQVDFMPMLKLRARSGDPYDDGYEAAREIVRRRVPDEVLTELLGAECEARVRRLIEMSGGYPREIVRLLQSLFTVETVPITDNDFNHIINEVGDAYRKVVPEDTFEWLATVAVDHYYTLQSDAHRQAADLMLLNNAVLRYLNDRDWFDLHPAVAQIPGVMHAITRLRATRA